jgi:hypothetical protein
VKKKNKKKKKKGTLKRRERERKGKIRFRRMMRSKCMTFLFIVSEQNKERMSMGFDSN